jgi:hypothetical protein
MGQARANAGSCLNVSEGKGFLKASLGLSLRLSHPCLQVSGQGWALLGVMSDKRCCNPKRENGIVTTCFSVSHPDFDGGTVWF